MVKFPPSDNWLECEGENIKIGDSTNRGARVKMYKQLLLINGFKSFFQYILYVLFIIHQIYNHSLSFM